MSRSEYYNNLKVSARLIREKYRLSSNRVLPGQIKKILISEGVKEIILFHDFRPSTKGIYLLEEDGAVIGINKSLPRDPYAFTLGHELKHHLHDKLDKSLICNAKNENEEIEIGAEIFSAELLYPENIFKDDLIKLCISKQQFKPEHLVELKVESDTTLSYAGLAKRAEFFAFAAKGSLAKIKWIKLQDSLYPNKFRYKR